MKLDGFLAGDAFEQEVQWPSGAQSFHPFFIGPHSSSSCSVRLVRVCLFIFQLYTIIPQSSKLTARKRNSRGTALKILHTVAFFSLSGIYSVLLNGSETIWSRWWPSVLPGRLSGCSALDAFHWKTYLTSSNVPKGRHSDVTDLIKGSVQACLLVINTRVISGGNKEVDKLVTFTIMKNSV